MKVIKVNQKEGFVIYPVYISWDKSKVIEVVDYYSNIYRNNWN